VDVCRQRTSKARLTAHQAKPIFATSKGFGAKPAPNQPVKKKATKGTDKAVEDALTKLKKENAKDPLKKEKEAQSQVPRHPDSEFIPKVNPADAAKGRLDYVQVEDWSVLDSDADMDNLKVKSFASQYDPADPSRAFYEQLCLHLQLLENKGELKVAQDPSKPLPPFEKWKFGQKTYMQYLADQYAVHEALEDAIFDAALRPLPPLPGQGAKVQAALRHIADLGLERCEALGDDILLLCAAQADAEAEGGEGSGRTADDVLDQLEPGGNAASFAAHIRQLGRKSMDTEDGEEKAMAAASDLLANWFVLHVSHLTTIMRIGAKATEELGLFQMGAINFYQTYPDKVEDPMKTFTKGVNVAGEVLGDQDLREEVREDLGKAMQKASILLTTLAVQES